MPLRSAKADAFVDHQAFELMEHRAVRCVVVATIDAAGHDDANRRLLVFHHADLHGRCVRAQHQSVVQVERVVHRARRMVRRNVERFEVVIVVFDLRTVDDA